MVRLASRVCAVLVGVLLVASGSFPALAASVTPLAVPATTITVDPAMPDGFSGWWLSAPDVSLTCDQSAVEHWSWNGGAEATAAVGAGTPFYAPDVPEGSSVLTAYAVNSGGETETPAVSTSIMVDSAPPTRPGNLDFSLGSEPSVALDWDPCTDTVSGVQDYLVYRNLTGPPFALADLQVAVAAPGWVDHDPPAAGLVYYAVAARDVAGHVSPLSDALQASGDLTPPTTPGDLQAWKNAYGWIRASWLPSTDLGSGVSYYEVSRSLDDGPWEVIAYAGSGSDHYDDHDAAASSAGYAEYDVVAVDRAGIRSGSAGPVLAGLDTDAPLVPEPVVESVRAADGLGGGFLIEWPEGLGDPGSGVLASLALYGPDPNAPAYTSAPDETGSSAFVEFDGAAVLWHFKLRAEDRAGNMAESGALPARNVPLVPLSGADRIETALLASAEAFDSADTVVVASARNYPDALCAASLAGVADAPILLVGPGPLTAATAEEIARLGADFAYVVGGPSAVSDETFDSLDQAVEGIPVRVAGTNRYETAAQVAGVVGQMRGSAPARVYVVTGETFPDALSVGAAAFAAGDPIVFARSGGVPQVTADVVRSIAASQTVVVGGTSAVSTDAEALWPGLVRLAGATRYETSRVFATWCIDEGVLAAKRPAIVTGLNFPDGLSAAPLAGVHGSPVLLARDAEADNLGAWLVPMRTVMECEYAVGGTAALSESVRAAVFAAVSVP